MEGETDAFIAEKVCAVGDEEKEEKGVRTEAEFDGLNIDCDVVAKRRRIGIRSPIRITRTSLSMLLLTGINTL